MTIQLHVPTQNIYQTSTILLKSFEKIWILMERLAQPIRILFARRMVLIKNMLKWMLKIFWRKSSLKQCKYCISNFFSDINKKPYGHWFHTPVEWGKFIKNFWKRDSTISLKLETECDWLKEILTVSYLGSFKKCRANFLIFPLLLKQAEKT